MVEIVPLLKRRPFFPHLIEKKRRFFTKYHFLKGRKCIVFGFGISLVFSHFASCDNFVISCKSCKTRVVCFCFDHSQNPLFLLWSDFCELWMYCWFLAFLLQKWCSSILSCFIDRFLTNRTCRYSCLFWLARLPWFSDLFNLLTFSTITMYIGVTLAPWVPRPMSPFCTLCATAF